MIAPLHLGPEALLPGLPVHPQEVGRRPRAGRSARRRSARGCSRPRPWPRCSRWRSRAGRWGRVTSTMRAPAPSRRASDSPEGGQGAGLDALLQEGPGHADPQAPRALARSRRRSRAPRIAALVASFGSCAAEDAGREGGVLHGAGERADLVEGRGEGHDSVAAHAAVGGLQADDAAQGRGLADRARRCRCPGPAAPSRRPPPPPSRPTSRRERARGPRGCGSSCRRCSRWTSPSRTRPCWPCPGRSRPRPRAARPRWR